MKITEYDFYLPERLIANQPISDRAASRMLLVDRGNAVFSDKAFSEITEILGGSDTVVINNTRVFPARLLGETETGAKVEIFLIRQIEGNVWQSLAKPARRLKVGRNIHFGSEISGVVEGKNQDGTILVKFTFKGNFFEILERIGKTPLPPYIKREAEMEELDRERYQTVYAKQLGAIAAPTAGLHFTNEILEKLKNKGTEIVEITLHVGYGTFEPVRVQDIEKHSVKAEQYSISVDAAERLNQARKTGRRIIAIGTTSTRALETNISRFGEFRAEEGLADITILPGYEFKAVDGLLTNFHLPKSSLILLVSAFAGRELIMKAYEHAIKQEYRFYSYGDCMLIL
jgi:S-adenosylmethionine:tRNA ribosyltransferase-isomerase